MPNDFGLNGGNMFTKDRDQICSAAVGCFPDMESLYSTISRDVRLHMERVAEYGDILYRYMLKTNPDLINKELGGDFSGYSKDVFRMHDIGRHYIPLSILNKVEELTEEELQIIKDHTLNATKAIDSVYRKPFPESVMRQFYNIAVFHHERYDGTGYPLGLQGEEIPLGARICAVVDSYDGIISWKVYKGKQTTREEALEIIREEAGKQFDPYVVDMFCACEMQM